MSRHFSTAFGLSRRAASFFAVMLALASATAAFAASVGSPPAAPPHLCVERLSDCGVVPVAAKGAKKWHPGHYMQTDFNATEATRFSYYDAIAGNTHIAGVVIGLKWSQIEGAKGDYSAGIALISSTLSKLKSLALPKRLFIRMIPQCYGSQPCACTAGAAKPYYPAYIVAMGGCGPITSGSEVAFWDPAVNDRYIALMQALAKAFDNDPYFEGIAPVRETAAAPVNGNFTYDALDTQWRRLALATSRAFVKSNVIFFTNYLASQTRMDAFIAYLDTIQVGAGDPDTCQDCKIYGMRTVRGLSGGVDYRGRMPLIWSVEASELGLNKVGPIGGYTAKQIYDFLDGSIQASHILWERQMYTGTSAQKWDPGMLAVINATPMTHTSCPKNYTQGCITD